MNKVTIQRIFFFALTFILIAASFTSFLTKNVLNSGHPLIKDGEVSLNDFKFSNSNAYSLSGEYKYYDRLFIISDELESSSYEHQTRRIPQSESTYIGNDYFHTNGYYGSYQALVKDVKPGTYLISMENGSVSYRIYVNQTLVTYRGDIYKDPSKNHDQLQYTAHSFEISEGEDFLLTIEYSSSFRNFIAAVPQLQLENSYVYFNETFNNRGFYLFYGLILVLTIAITIVYIISKKALFSLELILSLLFNNIAILFLQPNSFILDAIMMPLNVRVALYTCSVFFVIFFASKNGDFFFTKLPHKKPIFIFKIISLVLIILGTILKFFPPLYSLGQIATVTAFIIFLFILGRKMFLLSFTENKCYNVFYLYIICVLYHVDCSSLTLSGTSRVNFGFIGFVTFIIAIGLLTFLYALKGKEIYGKLTEKISMQQQIDTVQTTMLLSQIKSSFIFDSLNNIKKLIKTTSTKAESSLVKFSQFLRQNMNLMEANRLHLFEEDLKYIENYLALEMLNENNDFKVEYNIRVSDFYLPPLVLLPLISNAVKHCIKRSHTGGEIVLTTYEDEDNFYVKVADNGPGFNTQIIEDPDPAVATELKNIKQRLKKMCNGNLKITSIISKGTICIITLPKIDNFNVD